MLTVRRNHRRERRSLLLRSFLSHRLAVAGGTIVAVMMLLALFAPVLTPYDPLKVDVVNRLQAPSAEHVHGTDNFGRDVLTRIAYGARYSIFIGFAVAGITAVAGAVIGLLSAYYRAWDYILMRICDGLMAFPAILLAIAIMAALSPRVENVIIALAIVYTPNVARAVRSVALVVKEQTYIEAMGAIGAGDARIIFLHIARNCLTPLIVQCTFIFADAIISEAALSFLGAGIPSPAPSWGNILFDGKTFIFNAWWMVVFPGICLMLTVLGLNLFGDGLRDLLDPHTQSK
ncbi:ABC transporter permease [Paenibacillus sp. TRM 82003]|nr:ABC transporter permease [Paenibacillus sp. TRM 82003]